MQPPLVATGSHGNKVCPDQCGCTSCSLLLITQDGVSGARGLATEQHKTTRDQLGKTPTTQYQHVTVQSLDISDLDDVLESVKDVVDWMDLGLKLGILYPTMRKIEEEQRGRVERCKREMMAAWLQGEDNAKEQTWSTLMDALKRMDRLDLAENIQYTTVIVTDAIVLNFFSIITF